MRGEARLHALQVVEISSICSYSTGLTVVSAQVDSKWQRTKMTFGLSGNPCPYLPQGPQVVYFLGGIDRWVYQTLATMALPVQMFWVYTIHRRWNAPGFHTIGMQTYNEQRDPVHCPLADIPLILWGRSVFPFRKIGRASHPRHAQ